MAPRFVWQALPLVVAVMGLSCAQQLVDPSSKSTNKVLILSSSVNGGISSREAVATATFYGSHIDVVTPPQWSMMTAEQFMSYRALIIGDAACESGSAAFQAALDTRAAWGAIVDGNVAILATDPTTNNTGLLVENAIHFVLDSPQYLTGMYVALGCAYQDAPAGTAVALLEPFGSFQVAGVPGCADSAHMFQMFPSVLSDNLTDGMLSGAGCAARSVFTAYPEHTFAFAAVAQDSGGAPLPGQRTYSDFSGEHEVSVTGTPYLVVRGTAAKGAGCGTSDPMTGEECDLGDLLNGAPAVEGQAASETCSWSCHNNWCGDGVVDAIHGEECDDGVNNGRSHDATASIGACTSFCKVPLVQNPSHPPVAVCRDVTISATATCGAPADVNAGSYDPDGDLVACTPSPEGPYDMGTTRVTLTCVDRANHTATCTGVVTVTDGIAPTVSVKGPPNQTLECNTHGMYTPPTATASDPCEGPLPPSSITMTGSVNPGEPRSNPGYQLTYVATDSAGNTSSPVTINVDVVDTLSPVLTLNGPATQTLECGTPYADPGATASDQCAGDLTTAIVTTGTVDPHHPGKQTVRYSVGDGAGHTDSKSRTVNVVDTLPPTLTLNGSGAAHLMCGTEFTDPGATAFDDCAGDLTSQIVVSDNVDSSETGHYAVSYEVSDGAGHVATASRSVTVTSIAVRLADYTLFLQKNYSGGHHVTGKVAAGGNITLTDFSVGADLPNNDVARTLVAGGNLSLTRGDVWGATSYGGTYSASGTTYHRGTAARGTPINFTSRFSDLRSLSLHLGELTPTAGVTRSSGSPVVLSLTGTNPEVNVFQLNASELVGVDQLAIDAPDGSMVLVNIRGASATITNLAVNLSGGIDAHGVLFNLPDATTLTASGASIEGTILAPYANVTFNTGSWEGGMYAVSLTGAAEGHLSPLNERADCLSCH